MRKIASYLLAGFVIIIPTAATVYLIDAVVSVLNATTDRYVGRYFRGTLPGVDMLVAVVAICLTGVAVKNVFGRRVVDLYDAQLQKVPLVKAVYTTVRQALLTIGNPKSRAFRQMVIVEWPGPGLWTLGCLVSEDTGNGMASVFILKAPISLEGFTVQVAPDRYRVLEMPVEDGLRFMLSYGVLDGMSHSQAEDAGA